MTGRGKLTRKGMQGEIHRSEGPKGFRIYRSIPKVPERPGSKNGTDVSGPSSGNGS
jgi:hypothetical protein